MSRYMKQFADIPFLPAETRPDFRGNRAKILFGNEAGCMFRVTFAPGGFHAVHLHRNSDEFVYIISGSGLKGVEDDVYELKAGSSYYLPRGVSHWMLNTHPSEPIEVVGFYPGLAGFDDTGYEFLAPIPEFLLRSVTT